MEIERVELARSPAPILGLSPCKDKRNLLITMQSHGINVYEVYDHKCIMSWNLPPDLHLTSPAVQSFSSGRYFTVQDGKILLSWNQQDLVVNSWKKKKILIDICRSFVIFAQIDRHICSLLVHDSVKDHIFLTFDDGTFCAINEDLQNFAVTPPPLPHPNSPSSHIWAHLARAATDRLFLFNLIMNDNKFYFGVHEIHTSESSVNVTTVKYHHIEAVVKHKLVAISFEAFTRHLSLIWTDGTWEVLNFATLEALLSGSWQRVSTRQLNGVTLSGAQSKSRDKKRKTEGESNPASALSTFAPVSTAAFRNSVLCMSAVHEGEPFVTFWDMRFAALVGSLSLKLDGSTDNISSSTAVQVLASPDHRFVAVALDQRVLVCPTHCPQPSLALSVGTLSAASKFVRSDTDDLLRPPIAASLDLQKQLRTLKPLKNKSSHEEEEAEEDSEEEVEGAHGKKKKKKKDADVANSGAMSVSKPLRLELVTWREQFEQSSRDEEQAIRALVVDGAASEEKFSEIMKAHLEKTSAQNAKKPFVFQEEPDKPRHVKKTDSLQAIAAHISEKKDRKRKLKAMNSSPHVSQYFLVRVTTLCLERKYWRALRWLLKTRLLALPAVPNLLAELRKQNRLDVLEFALKFLNEISEEELVTCAQYLLSTTPQTRSEMAAHIVKKKIFQLKKEKLAAEGNSEAVLVSADDAVEKYLNIIVAKPKNDVFMIQYLKELSVPQAKALLQYLLKWLDHHSETVPSSLDKREHLAVPTFSNVIDWLNMLIDSHLTKLLLMDEWQEQVIELKQLVNAQVEFCDRIQPIKGQLQHLLNGGSLPSQERLTDYSIEILKF